MYYSKIITLIIISLSLNSCVNRKKITFHKDIKPIIHENCASCHHNNGAGPFNLISYQDISKRANMILEVVENNYMPPWPADPNFREFANQKILTTQEKTLLKKWIRQGIKEGDKDTINYLQRKIDQTPDLTIKMDKNYITKGNNQDEFLMMKFPFELERDTFIKYIEFVPGNNQIVHHINAHLISYEDNKKTDIFNGKKYVDTEEKSDQEAFNLLEIHNDDGSYPRLTPSVSNYLPGSEPFIYPEGIGGFNVKKKNIILVNDFHYAPTIESLEDSSYFKIFFDSIAPVRPVQETQLGTFGISDIIPPLIIPPNEIKTFYTSAIITRDISLLTINPHMHLLGKSFIAYAVDLKNDTIPLIKIDNWNFRWQYFYHFIKPIKIQGGSEIIVKATYDNTVDNPDNPFDPPKEISERRGFNGKGSMRTSDEMLQFIINYLPYEKGDENIKLILN